MKSKAIKKMLAAAMGLTLILGCQLTSLAAGSGSAAPAVPEPAPSVSQGGGAADGSEAAAAAAEEAAKALVSGGAAVSVAGKSVKTAIAGAYAAHTVQGVAVLGSTDSIAQSLKLAAGQTPYIIVFDTDAKKSHLAMDCVNAAAEALGAKVEATLNIDLGVKKDGNFVRLSDGSVGMVIGLPKGADTSKTVSVVCVQPGGIVTILPDTDKDPNTVTFPVQAGLGTYAIVTK